MKIIDEDYGREELSDREDEELIAARETVGRTIEEHGLREKARSSKKEVLEEVNGLGVFVN